VEGSRTAKRLRGRPAERNTLKRLRKNKVPTACWEMFEAFCGMEGKGKRNTLADLVSLVMEASCYPAMKLTCYTRLHTRSVKSQIG
jgi:hypothetical protein